MQTKRLKVTGISCDGCVSGATKVLKAVDGVNGVSVSLADGATTVSYDEHLTSNAILKSAVIAAGYGVGAQASASKGGCCG